MAPLSKRKDLKFVPGKGYVSIKKAQESSQKTSGSNVVPLSSILSTFKGEIDTSNKRKSSGVNPGSQVVVTPRIEEISTGRVVQQSQTTIQKPQSRIQKQFNDAGLGLLAKTYNDRQLEQIRRRVINDNSKKVFDQLYAIDNRRDLTPIQKNLRKREILGVKTKSGDFGKSLKLRKSKKNKELSELIKVSPSEQLAKKVLNGESLTPSQQQRYSDNINKQSKELTKQQIKLLKNAPKNVGLGVWEFGKETVVFGRDVIIASYNYGASSAKKANSEGKSVLNIFGRDTKKLLNVAAITTGKVSGFIQKNPKKAAAMVGAAATLAGTSYLKAFEKNPVKTLTKSALYLASGTALKGVKGAVKITKSVIVNTYRTTKVKNASQLTRVKKNIATLEQGIKKVKDTGVNVRQKTRQAQYLRNAEKELTLLVEERKILSSAIGELEEIISMASKAPIKNPTIKKANNKIKATEKKLKTIKTKKQKLKKQRQRLSDIKKSELLGKFFKESQGVLKIKKNIPSNQEQLIKALLDARKQGGSAFSQFKKKIKKQFNLNVVERKTKDGSLTYKLLEPKRQLKKGKSTGVKSKPKLIKIDSFQKKKIPTQKIKSKDNAKAVIDITESLNKDKIIAFTIGKRNMFSNKKAQVSLSRGVVRGYKKLNTQYKQVRAKIKGYRQQYRRINEKQKVLRSKSNGSKQKNFQALEQRKKTIKSEVAKLENEIKSLSKKSNKLLKGSLSITALIPALKNSQNMKQAQAQLQAQLQDMSQISKMISDFTKQTPQIPKAPKPPGPKPPRRPTSKPPKPPVIPKVPKVPRVPKKPPVPPKQPPEKPVKFPKLRFSFDSKNLKDKIALFEGTYRERRFKTKPAGKNNPVVTKKIRIRTTKNRMLKVLSSKIDNSAARTMNIKVLSVGDKKKDVKRPDLKKFRLRKKGLIEKAKYAMDKPGEKREIRRSRKSK